MMKKLLSIFLILVLSLVISGCFTTKQHFEILDDKLNTIRKDQKEMSEKVNYLDSLIRVDTEESIKLKADLSSSVRELIEQFQTTQVILNDFQIKFDEVMKNQSATPYVQVAVQSDKPDTTADSTGTDTTVTEQPAMSSIDCQNLYDDSFINIRSGQYEEAISGFHDYLEFCGSQGQADNARFWIGEAYYSTEKFKEAISEFDLLINDYPDSEKQASAMYKMARSHVELGQKTEAIKVFEQIIEDFPGTLEANQAQERLDELKG